MDLATTLITLLLGGGGASTIVGIIVARRKRTVDADSVVVQGAETAVLTLERAVAAAVAAEARTAAERDRLQVRLDAETSKREALEARLDVALKLIGEITAELDAVRKELHADEEGVEGV